MLDSPEWVCTEEAFIQVGDWIIDCDQDRQDLRRVVEFKDEDRELLEEQHAADLDTWRRYFWTSVGVGGAATLIATLIAILK